jgi:hypothetical protein
MKEDRKKAELESEVLKNRVILLQTQEKAVFCKYERTKSQIDQILQNRKYFHQEDKRNKVWKENTKKEADELKERVQKMRISRSTIASKIKKDDYRNKTNKNIKSQTYDRQVIIINKFFLLII